MHVLVPTQTHTDPQAVIICLCTQLPLIGCSEHYFFHSSNEFQCKACPGGQKLSPQEPTACCCSGSVLSCCLAGVDLTNTAALMTWRAPKTPAVSSDYA